MWNFQVWGSDENASHNRKCFILYLLYLYVKTIRSNRVKQHLVHFEQRLIAKHFTYWMCYLNWRFRCSSSRNFLNSLTSPSRALKRQHRRTHFHAHCTLWLRQSFAWAPHHHVFCTTLNGQGKKLLDNLFIFSAFNDIASPSLNDVGKSLLLSAWSFPFNVLDPSVWRCFSRNVNGLSSQFRKFGSHFSFKH